jgi:hypothetical protein
MIDFIDDFKGIPSAITINEEMGSTITASVGTATGGDPR